MNIKESILWRKVFGFSATFLLVLFFTGGCKKKDSNLGINTIDSNELLNSAQIDTFSLTTFTIEEDSVISDNPAYAVLGSYNDPKFGTFKGSFYTQFRLSGTDPNFGDISTITIDSLILGLEYAGYYGSFTNQTLEVFEMTESIYIDSTYYSFSTKNHSVTNLVETGYETFTPDPNGITVIGADTVDTQLRIRLKNALAQQFIDEADPSGGATFSSNENFLNYFKGLYVNVNNGSQSSGSGGVFYFNLNDPLSKLTIYYKQAGVSKTYDFLINSECADFNHVDVNNSGTNVQTVINDTISGQSEYYSQAFNSRAIIDIPGIENIPKNAIIHKAELILPIQYQTGAKYLPPNELSVSARINGVLSGIGVFGFFDYSYKKYTIDIKNYLQAYVSGQINTTELILSPRYFINSAERVIFNGPSTINKSKPKLVVTYTEF
jgi:hypothetical protein